MKVEVTDDGTLLITAESYVEAFYLRNLEVKQVVLDGNWSPVESMECEQ